MYPGAMKTVELELGSGGVVAVKGAEEAPLRVSVGTVVKFEAGRAAGELLPED